MKITCKENCENVPKERMLRDFNIAFGKADMDGVLAQMTDDIVWEMVGDKTMRGKDEVLKALEEMKAYTAEELNIHHIITHGHTAACNGNFQMQSGESYGFCDIYLFNNHSETAKIKEMTSYGIALKS